MNIIKVTKTYAQLAAAALTNDIEVYSLPAGCRIESVTIDPTVAFTGGAIAAYTLSVGITGNLTKFAAAFSVFTTGSQQDSNNFSVESWTAATSIRLAAISVGANLNAATAGSVDIYIGVAQVKQ